MKTRHRHLRRSGNVLILALLLMIASFALLAFAVDLGYIQVVGVQMQRAADAAAIAAAGELRDNSPQAGGNAADASAAARTVAGQYTALNTVAGTAALLAQSDVSVGYLQNPSDPSQPVTFADANRFNTVRVLIRRTADQNGEVPLFFARVLGMNTHAGQAEATAAFVSDFSGFSTPSSGENLDILPFALDKQTWDAMLAGNAGDNWTWDPVNKRVVAGRDGILEVNLYPEGIEAPGNRGTVDIGASNNSTADIARQIVSGISANDLAQMGGKLQLDDTGKLMLNGDTGISAGVKDELASIIGQPRIIPIFSQVSGNGNNAMYTIVQFAGIRIVEVKLTGSNKRVIVQPATVITRGGIPGSNQTSNGIFSPPWLVR